MELKTKTVKGMQLKHMITKCLYFDKAMSCAELSELFDKSIPSIAKALNELIEKGFVVEEGYAPSSGEAVILSVDGYSDFNALHSRRHTCQSEDERKKFAHQNIFV